MLRASFAASLLLPMAVLGQDCIDKERYPFPVVAGASYDGNMSDTNNRRLYDLVDDDWYKTTLACWQEGSEWLRCKFQAEMKPCKQKIDVMKIGISFGLNNGDFWDWAYLEARDLYKTSITFTLKDGSDGPRRDAKEDYDQSTGEGWTI